MQSLSVFKALMVLALCRQVVRGLFFTSRNRRAAFPSYKSGTFLHGGGNGHDNTPATISSSLAKMSSSSNTSSAVKQNDIVLPEREYGYRTEPLTWRELQSIIVEEKNLAKLSRSVKQQIEYEIYMRDLKTKWKSIYDHILVTKFGFEKLKSTDKSSGLSLWEASPPLSQIKDPRKVLVLNDFPYFTAAAIHHYVLWKIGGDVTDADIDEARQELREKLGDVVDLLHWKNPPHLKSLPDLDHVHLLCLREANNPNSKI